MEFRQANLDDLKEVSRFTDWWLSGRGRAKGAPGAVDDCFISTGQHKKYILKYQTWLCVEGKSIIAWSVVEPSGTLIHLLVAGDRRKEGIGKSMMLLLKPRCVRSKLDQSTGNPIGFYESLGYRKVSTEKSRSRLDIDLVKPFRAENIDVLEIDGLP